MNLLIMFLGIYNLWFLLVIYYLIKRSSVVGFYRSAIVLSLFIAPVILPIVFLIVIISLISKLFKPVKPKGSVSEVVLSDPNK